MTPSITVRPATPADEAALGRYGAALMRQHHAADPARFLEIQHAEAGYGRFLVSELEDPGTVVLVAESSGSVVGYVYASVEGVSWRELRGPSGYVHDVYVDAAARGMGAGRALLGAAIEWIRGHGRTQVVLLTKTGNAHAQDLFGRLGFRRTMIEMTLDLDEKGEPRP